MLSNLQKRWFQRTTVLWMLTQDGVEIKKTPLIGILCTKYKNR